MNKTKIYPLDKESNRIFIVDVNNKNITKDIALGSLHGSPDQLDEIFFFDTKMEKIYIANQVGNDLKICGAISKSDVQFHEDSGLEHQREG